MTDGTHRGAILDRDSDKLARAKVLLGESKSLSERAQETSRRSNVLLAESSTLNEDAVRLVAAAKRKREEAEFLVAEVGDRQKSEAQKAEGRP